MFDIVIIIIIIIQIMFLSIRGKEQSREAASTVIPSGQEEETSICQSGNKYANTAGRMGGVARRGGGGTYKSSAAASLGVVALVIPGASVGRAAVVPRREAWVIVALLRVLHPLPHVVFTSEGWRVGGGGGRGRGGRRGAVALLFRLPVQNKQTQGGGG